MYLLEHPRQYESRDEIHHDDHDDFDGLVHGPAHSLSPNDPIIPTVEARVGIVTG